VLGTVESIGAMTRASIASYYRRRYRSDQLVITAAGNVDHNALVKLVKRAFRDVAVDDSRSPAAPRVPSRAIEFEVGTVVRGRPTEQANIVCGVPGLSRHDDRRFALGVLNTALGGGMSSRLFQEIRELRGLAYSVYSFTSHYSNGGLFGIYAGCHPDRARQVVDLCREQVALAAADGLTADELARGKGQMRGGLVLGLEDTGSRMSRLGKAELVYGELTTVEEMLARIDAVTLDETHALAVELLGHPDSLAVIGPFDGAQAFAA
jgi:predicted Zn-dependent peptidase